MTVRSWVRRWLLLDALRPRHAVLAVGIGLHTLGWLAVPAIFNSLGSAAFESNPFWIIQLPQVLLFVFLGGLSLVIGSILRAEFPERVTLTLCLIYIFVLYNGVLLATVAGLGVTPTVGSSIGWPLAGTWVALVSSTEFAGLTVLCGVLGSIFGIGPGWAVPGEKFPRWLSGECRDPPELQVLSDDELRDAGYYEDEDDENQDENRRS